MKQRKMRASGHVFDSLFSYLVLGLLGMLALLVVIMGAGVYRSVVQSQTEVEQAGISLSYVQNKVRSYDAIDAVGVENRNGIETLILREAPQDDDYATLIYYYDGALREYVLFPGDDFVPADGDNIIELGDFSATLTGRQLVLRVTSESGEETVSHLTLRTGGSDGVE